MMQSHPNVIRSISLLIKLEKMVATASMCLTTFSFFGIVISFTGVWDSSVSAANSDYISAAAFVE